MHTTQERRRHQRKKRFASEGPVNLQIQDNGTGVRQLRATIQDSTDSGLGVQTDAAIAAGTSVVVSGSIADGVSGHMIHTRTATVVHCRPTAEGGFSIGLLFAEEKHSSNGRAGNGKVTSDPSPDYYDILQLSPNADGETIQRVFRLLAQRYHPDNLETGDQSQFKAVLDAYRVLNDPEQRAAYDVTLTQTRQIRWKIFDQAEAAHGKEGERRKRAGILSLLYTRRLNEPLQPGMQIQELEELLGCPREHLEFTLWYLREKSCIVRSDNGRYTITTNGVDYAESDNEMLPVRPRLLEAAEQD